MSQTRPLTAESRAMRSNADWPLKTRYPSDTPGARASDPVTSHIAAATVLRTGKRARNQGIALGLVLSYPGFTACELAQMTVLIDRYELSRRLPEVADDGAICKGERRRSRVTGNYAVTWHKAPDLRAPDPNWQPTLF